MKTHRNLYEKIYDFDNLHKAYLEARKNKRFRDEVLMFSANLEENLINLQNHLIYQTYKVGRYKERYVHIPKTRLIMALPFADRVVQWAVYRVVQPIFRKSYISTTYGSLEGGGALAAMTKLQYWLRLFRNKHDRSYVLKLDITKFFFRVPHDVLMRVLRKKIADERLLWLLETIFRSEDTPFGFHEDVADVMTGERLWGIGMPVGNLLSQMMANAVLNELDQYVKRELRVKYYMRYMDDMCIISSDKKELHELKQLIDEYLTSNLGLALNNKSSIRPTSLGVEFVGYRIWADKTKMKKATALRMKRRLQVIKKYYENGEFPLEKCKPVLMGYLGLLQRCSSTNLRDKILEDFVLVRKCPPEEIE